MKNNEILVSVKIEDKNLSRTLSFLVIKDTTLKSFIQGVYYGLGKMAKKKEDGDEAETLTIQECYSAFERYIKTHRELLVLYTIMGRYAKLNINEESVDELDEKKPTRKNYDMPLSSLGIVTASQILITDKTVVESVPQLFEETDKQKTYILRENNTLEYNISTRRLNVIEPTEIDILPAGDMPAAQKGSLLDTIAPPIITGLGMVGLRFLIGKFTDNSAFNSSMMAMTIAMPFMSAVNSVYGRKRQSKEHRESVADWKEKYEKYINETIIKKKIVQWQRDEIIYLNKVYPQMGVLFNEAGEISTVIFSRSQNDNDFMRISLGESDEIRPSFQIKAEQKDDIFYDVHYKLYLPESKFSSGIVLKILQYPKGMKSRKKNDSADEQYAITDLPFSFSSTKKERSVSKKSSYIDLKSVRKFGVVSADLKMSTEFIEHFLKKISPPYLSESVNTFIFFMTNDQVQQEGFVKRCSFLPILGHPFENLQQIVFNKQQMSLLLKDILKNADSVSGNVRIVFLAMGDVNIENDIDGFTNQLELTKSKINLAVVYIQRDHGLLPTTCDGIAELHRAEEEIAATPYIEIILPDSQKSKGFSFRKNKTKYQQTALEMKNQFLLTELPYVFSTTQDGEVYGGKPEQTGFKFLRDSSRTGKKPPLLIDLRNIGTLGVISKDKDISLQFIKHLAFELSFYHSPEDLQMVFFFNKESDTHRQNEIVEDYLFLPHTNELFDNLSQFVFDEKSAGEVFSQLQTIVSERAKSTNSEDSDDNGLSEKHTQIVCFVLDDYDIKEKAFSKYIPEAPVEGEEYVNSLGLTFVFIKREKGMLPKYCGSIVELDGLRRVSNRYNLLSHETLSKLAGGNDSSTTTDDIIEYTRFSNQYIFGDGTHPLPYDEFSLAFRRLSSIYYTRIAENGKVPSLVTLFELYQDIYDMDSASIQGDGLTGVIRKNWTELKEKDPTTPKNDVTKDLQVAMGKNEHGITYLDLHENADGPHMLVAGTTGSGKSETIITYLIGLCVKYSPIDLNLMLVDMKGGGFSERLGKLPHCVGTVTNTAGESQGISAVYMLKRFLESLNAEVKNRQIILADLDVDNADAYIKVLRKIKKIHELRNSTDTDSVKIRDDLIKEIQDGKKEKQIRFIDGDISVLKPLSHLILVVDEFTELKRFSSESDDVDFIAEITTIARIGRTLGLHIILVSQNIEGAINDDIRVNTKSKICLKVATKQASKEMLGTTDAAAATMPGHGRAYILVGTGSRYEYFQSAYTGANKNTDIKPPTLMTYVTNTGRFIKDFYDSSKDNDIQKAKNKRLSAGVTQLEYVVEKIIELASESDFELPEMIFQEPLPTELTDDTDEFNEWIGV